MSKILLLLRNRKADAFKIIGRRSLRYPTTRVGERYSNFGLKIAEAGYNRGNLRSALGLGSYIIDLRQAHHSVPIELLDMNQTVRNAVEEGWDINNRSNALALTNDRHSGSHPRYTDWVNSLVDQYRRNPRLNHMTDTQIVEIVSRRAQTAINGTTGKINEIDFSQW